MPVEAIKLQINPIYTENFRLVRLMFSGTDSGSKSLPDPGSLFGILQNQFEAEKCKGTMTPGYVRSLEDVMERLAPVVNAAKPNQTLTENIVDRDKMSDQMTDMLGRIRSTTFQGSQRSYQFILVAQTGS